MYNGAVAVGVENRDVRVHHLGVCPTHFIWSLYSTSVYYTPRTVPLFVNYKTKIHYTGGNWGRTTVPSELGWKKVMFADTTAGHVRESHSMATMYLRCRDYRDYLKRVVHTRRIEGPFDACRAHSSSVLGESRTHSTSVYSTSVRRHDRWARPGTTLHCHLVPALRE